MTYLRFKTLPANPTKTLHLFQIQARRGNCFSFEIIDTAEAAGATPFAACTEVILHYI